MENKCEDWMNKYDELREKYLQLETKCINVEKENNDYRIEIARIKMIENENSRLCQSIDKSHRVREELESALESCHEIVYKYKVDLEVARDKAKEAVEVADKTCLEKEQLVKDLQKSNDEITRLGNELKNVIQEAGTKVHLEVKNVKSMYKDKLREADIAIESLRTENQISSYKRKQVSREYGLLKEKYDSINEKFSEEPDEHSKKVTLLAKQAEKYEETIENLTADVESLKETNRKLQEGFATKKAEYATEITFLKDTVKSLESHLNRAINEIAESSKNHIQATDRIKMLEMENSKLKRLEERVEQKNVKINALTENVEAQKKIADMWRIEMRNLIEGFEHKIGHLK